MSLPAGTVSEPAPLTISKRSDTSGSLSYKTSDTFTLGGLPMERDSDITVTVDSPPTAGSDQELVIFKEAGDSYHGPLFAHTTRNGNQFSFTIPAMRIDPTVRANTVPGSPQPRDAVEPIPRQDRFMYVWYVMKGLKPLYSDSNRFVLFYDSSQVTFDQARAITALDQAYAALGGTVKLNWGLRTQWPIEVFLYPYSTFLHFFGDNPDDAGNEGSHVFGITNQQINLNSAVLARPGGLDEVKITAGHELFHVLQNLYDPSIALTAGVGNWLWMLEASATWFERFMAPAQSYVSSNASRNMMFLTLHGLEWPPGDKREAANHGYGASMLLEHLGSTYGDAFIGNIIQSMSQANTIGILPSPALWPTDGITKALPVKSLAQTWLDSCGSFMAGTVLQYRGGPPEVPNVLALNPPKETTLNSGSDSFSANDTFPDLSAKVYVVHFRNPANWKTNTTLRATLNHPHNNGAAWIYNGRGSTWQLVATLGANRTTTTIANAETLPQNNTDWYIMVANGDRNPQGSGSTNVAFTLTAAANIPTPGYVRANLSVAYKFIGSDGKTYTYPAGANALGIDNRGSLPWDLPVTWSGGNFSMDSGDLTLPSAFGAAGTTLLRKTITGSADPASGRLISLVMKTHMLQTQAPNTGAYALLTHEETKQYTFTDIANSGGSNALSYALSGSALNGHFTAAWNNIDRQQYSNSPLTEVDGGISGVTVDSNASLWITFTNSK